MKDGKSAGPDSIPAEALNMDIETRRSGKRDKSHENGRKVTSSSCQRRVTSENGRKVTSSSCQRRVTS